MLSIWAGIVIYAKYHDCDPIMMGFIKRHDQVSSALPNNMIDLIKSQTADAVFCNGNHVQYSRVRISKINPITLILFYEPHLSLPGIFVASVFSGSLSTLSSGFNALATVTWDDFVKRYFRDTPEKQTLWITKGIGTIDHCSIKEITTI